MLVEVHGVLYFCCGRRDPLPCWRMLGPSSSLSRWPLNLLHNRCWSFIRSIRHLQTLRVQSCRQPTHSISPLLGLVHLTKNYQRVGRPLISVASFADYFSRGCRQNQHVPRHNLQSGTYARNFVSNTSVYCTAIWHHGNMQELRAAYTAEYNVSILGRRNARIPFSRGVYKYCELNGIEISEIGL
jgi:hypothetical protein